MKGKLKFNNRFSGYGHVKALETGIEYYVSPAGIQDPGLKDGDTVLFDVEEGRDRLKAVNVRVENFKRSA